MRVHFRMLCSLIISYVQNVYQLNHLWLFARYILNDHHILSNFFSSSGSGQRPTDGSTHSSSSSSFHSSRGPLAVHNSWTEKPMGRGVNPHHNQHHLQQQLPPHPDSYRENIPGAEFQPPHCRELKLGVDKEKKTLRDIVPPLCASRLKAIRQRTKNAVVRKIALIFRFINLEKLFSHLIYIFLCFLQVSILDTGEVCMELLKCQGGQERVKEVLRISCDGSMVNLLYWLLHIPYK